MSLTVEPIEATTTSLWSRVSDRATRNQFLRYLCVGTFNTVFGYAIFATLNFFLRKNNVPVSYLFATAISNFINITVAYFMYKTFVFRTKGNHLQEWLKALAVYWSGFLPSLVLLPLTVRVLNHLLPVELTAFHHTMSRVEAAPYLASAFWLCTNVFTTFIAHKKITFREKKAS